MHPEQEYSPISPEVSAQLDRMKALSEDKALAGFSGFIIIMHDLRDSRQIENPSVSERVREYGNKPGIWDSMFTSLQISDDAEDRFFMREALEDARNLGMDEEPEIKGWLDLWQEKYGIIETQKPEQEIDYEKEVNEIEAQVKARAIHGKFPPLIRLKGQEIQASWVDDYQNYGDREANVERVVRSRNFQLSLYYNASEFQDQPLFSKHFIMAEDIPNSQDALVSYYFPVRWVDPSLRPAHYATISFRVPKEASTKLLGLVRKNPETAEMFLQKAAEGFEESEETYAISGIPRVRSEEICIVNLDRFDPNDIQYSPTDMLGRQKRVTRAAIQNRNDEIETYKYVTAHGVLDPNKRSPFETRLLVKRYGTITKAREVFQKQANDKEQRIAAEGKARLAQLDAYEAAETALKERKVSASVEPPSLSPGTSESQKPFAYFREAEPAEVAKFLESQDLQTVADVLISLGVVGSAPILSHYDPILLEKLTEVITKTREVSPETVSELDQSLQAAFEQAQHPRDFSSRGF